MDIMPVLDHLSSSLPEVCEEWQGWRISPISGGHNNLLFRITRPDDDFAVKFTRRDARDRAGREYQALALLHAFAPGLAPAPVLLERDRWPLPVVVQTWLEGQSSDRPPVNSAEWQCLADHYRAIHAITPALGPHPLLDPILPAVISFPSARAGVDYALAELRQIPQEGRPPRLCSLARRLEQACSDGRFPTWPAPALTLGRTDPNIANFLRPAGGAPWRSVDWENSGWTDPALELGDLMAHPCYKNTSPQTWETFLQAFSADHRADPGFAIRVRVFHALMLVRFAGIYARSIWQRDHAAPDPTRLKQWSPEWWQSLDAQYSDYLSRSDKALLGFEG